MIISKWGTKVSNIVYKPGRIVSPTCKISYGDNLILSFLSHGNLISSEQWTSVSSKSNSRVYFLRSK